MEAVLLNYAGKIMGRVTLDKGEAPNIGVLEYKGYYFIVTPIIGEALIYQQTDMLSITKLREA